MRNPEVMSLKFLSMQQLEPYLPGSLNNPSKDMLLRSQAAPVHNMLSEQTLGLADYHVRHAPNVNIHVGFIDGKMYEKSNTILASEQSS